MSNTLERVYEQLRIAGGVGRIAPEIEKLTGLGHGAVSGALSRLHQTGKAARLQETRSGRHKVYVASAHVRDRATEPYGRAKSAYRVVSTNIPAPPDAAANVVWAEHERDEARAERDRWKREAERLQSVIGDHEYVNKGFRDTIVELRDALNAMTRERDALQAILEAMQSEPPEPEPESVEQEPVEPAPLHETFVEGDGPYTGACVCGWQDEAWYDNRIRAIRAGQDHQRDQGDET